MADDLWRECANWLIRCRIIPPDHRVTWRNAQVIDLANTLRDGVLLCHLLNSLVPGCIDLKEINLRPQMSQFLCQKNIRSFLQTCQTTFELKSTDLFEPHNLFDCSDFVRVLHTLSKLSMSPQSSAVRGFSILHRSTDHDYYNDDIYRNLEDLANDECGYLNCYDEVPITQGEDEDIYEDLCAFSRKKSKTETPLFPEPPVEKRDYCIKELVETEKNYIEALNMVIRHFMLPLKKKLNPDDRKIIFLNIKELAEVHASFHGELVKACLGGGTFHISDCFLHWKDKFIIYGDYCSNLPRAQELVEELCTKQEEINNLVSKCQMEANEGKFKLRDLLSVPMQRVLKYHLLLKELIRNTPRTHEDFSGLEKALDAMLDLAQYINEVKRDNETLQIIRDIQNSITDLAMPDNTELKDYGRLLKDGELKIRSHTDNNKMKNRYIFVFDRVVLMCKTTRMVDKLLGGEQYSYKEALVLTDYRIEDISKPTSRDKWSCSWFLVHKKNKQAYTMYAKTEEMKRKWIEAINKAYDNVTPSECRDTDHVLEMHTFEKPRTCVSCEKWLRGVFFQGYVCHACDIGVHKGCISSIRCCGAPILPPRPGDSRSTAQELIPETNHHAEMTRHPISSCIAKLTHHSTIPGYLSFLQGDTIHIFRKLSLLKWEGRVERTGQEGFLSAEYIEERGSKRSSYEVPPNLVPPYPPKMQQQQQAYVNLDLGEFPWFAGNLDKDHAMGTLENLPDGTFLVRISERQKGMYVISIKHDNKVKHMKVQIDETRGQHLYYLSTSKYFKSIVELIQWYQENSLETSFSGLDITLMRPYKQLVSGAVPIGYAIVNYDFSATSANMLSLRTGERVGILCKRGGDKGWWKGQLNGKVGFFPMLYVTEEVSGRPV